MKKRSLIFCCWMLINSFQVHAEVLQDDNGITISEQELNVFLGQGPLGAQRIIIKDRVRLKQKIENMYLTKAIAEIARKEGLGNSQDEQIRLQALIDRFYYQQKIKALENDNLPDFDALAKLHYKTNAEQYIRPEQVDTSHILIDFKSRSEQEALKLAEEIHGKAVQGESFTSLAAKYSDDKSVATNNGHLGWYAKGVMVKEYDQVAFALQPDDISQPVKTAFGYHIIRLNAHKPRGKMAFAEAKPEIVAQLKQNFINTRKELYFDKVELDNHMQFNEQALDSYMKQKLDELTIPPSPGKSKSQP